MYGYDLTTNAEYMRPDLLDEVRQFGGEFATDKISVTVTREGKLQADICVRGSLFCRIAPLPVGDALTVKRLEKRFVKHSLYLALSEVSGIKLPWGSLTGIRPTKLAYAYLRDGGSEEKIADYLINTFEVRRDRAEIVRRIIAAQRSALGSSLNGAVDLYVHVPFCNGRCNYCSFPSADISRKGADKLLSKYTDALIREIRRMTEFISSRGERILSVYVGGGTPSVLGEDELARLLDAINVGGVEFTFEAGRADSFTKSKAEIMKSGGITRICMNPQTLNNGTLSRIGRRHTAEQFYEAYSLARSLGFTINTDIIAGLEGETLSDFERTADGIRQLSPENVTVHTLSRKRASLLADTDPNCPDIERMIDHALMRFADYEPYYLYRQKNMAGNLENIGFCKKGSECINNITVMEELVPVYACGAGSISKRVGKVIARFASPKDVGMYINELDERTDKKLAFLAGE